MDIFDGGQIVHTASPVDGVVIADVALDGSGEHQLTARYNGDRNFAASLDLAPPISQTIEKATANSALGQSPNTVTLAGQDVSFTSTITPLSSTNVFTPTGNVTFTDGGLTLGTAPLNGGVATLTRQLDAGLHKVVATYAGDQNFEPTAFASVVHSVDKASTTNMLIRSRTSTVVGEPFDLTSTIGVVEPGSGSPTGTVTFTNLSTKSTIGTDTISVLRGDPTSVTTSALAVGSHQLTSTYNGDGDYHPQTASPITHVVAKATTQRRSEHIAAIHARCAGNGACDGRRRRPWRGHADRICAVLRRRPPTRPTRAGRQPRGVDSGSVILRRYPQRHGLLRSATATSWGRSAPAPTR